MTWLYGIVIPVNGTNSLDEPRFWFAYVAFAVAIPFIFCSTKKVAVDRLIGDLSYPLYIVHGLVIGVAYSRLGHPEGDSFVALAAGLSLVAAIAMRVTVEIPTERWLQTIPLVLGAVSPRSMELDNVATKVAISD